MIENVQHVEESEYPACSRPQRYELLIGLSMMVLAAVVLCFLCAGVVVAIGITFSAASGFWMVVGVGAPLLILFGYIAFLAMIVAPAETQEALWVRMSGGGLLFWVVGQLSVGRLRPWMLLKVERYFDGN